MSHSHERISNIWLNQEENYPNLIYGIAPRIKLNVCGHIYEIYTGILDAYPNTLLGDREKREKYRLNDDTLFLHRHPTVFSYILYYYIQGFIHRPTNIPYDVFIEECRYFSIPYYLEENSFILHLNDIKENNTTVHKYLRWFSFLITILSCIVLFSNDLLKENLSDGQFSSNGQIVYNFNLFHSIFIWIDIICTIWFMIEFYIQYYYLSNSIDLNRNFNLFIDIMSIGPIFLSLLTNTFSRWFNYLNLLYPFYICLKSFRILRFIRYIPSLDLIRQTLFLSLDYISIPFILCSLFIIPFGIMIYLIERVDPSASIVTPDIGLYWAIETLTTIGFGEYIPSTYEGKLLSIVVCIFGFMLLSIPVPIIFQNFKIIYENSLKKDLWIKFH